MIAAMTGHARAASKSLPSPSMFKNWRSSSKRECARLTVKELNLCTFSSQKELLRVSEKSPQANAEVPQNDLQARKAAMQNPKGGIGLVISSKASLEEVATWIAKRTLERWVRVLKPFASGPGLAVLISRLVHEDYTRLQVGSPTARGEIMQIIPPTDDLLGLAFRRLTPMPHDVNAHPWAFIEDMESALNLEVQFNSNPDHPLRPNCQIKTPSRTSSSMSRPASVSNLQTMSPKGCSGALRRSGAFPWADFQPDNGNRQTFLTSTGHKQLRKFPGPDTYGDVGARFVAPERASWGRFPGAGGRRSLCTTTPLSHLGRYFEADHVKTR